MISSISWEKARPFIERAFKRGSQFTLDDVERGLATGYMRAWGWEDTKLRAALVTYFHGTRFVMMALSGEKMRDWLGEITQFEAYAKRMGCTEMVIHGRKGWSRVLGYDVIGEDEIGLPIMSKLI